MSLSAETTTRAMRSQSSSGPPTQEFVEVAVLPPRLPPGMAAPTGLGPAEAFSWDEKLNWTHNEKIDQAQPEPSGAKKWFKKAGITTERKKATENPPFIIRKVPYETWRKHYAKDKDGRFQGTGTPAEDCLLLPADVEKWRLGAPVTKGDQWTRGKEALPVYGDSERANTVPEYTEQPTLVDSKNSLSGPSQPQRNPSTFTADGKTAEQIIQEAKERNEAKKNQKGGWKNTMKRATEYTMMGAG